MARADAPIMQWQGNPRNLPIRDGSISLNWSALVKWDPRSKIGLVWKFQLEPRMDLGNGHTVTLTVSFRSSRRVIIHDGVRVEYTVREDRVCLLYTSPSPRDRG